MYILLDLIIKNTLVFFNNYKSLKKSVKYNLITVVIKYVSFFYFQFYTIKFKMQKLFKYFFNLQFYLSHPKNYTVYS